MNIIPLDLGPLSPLIADPSITEIMVNSAENIFIEKDGALQTINTKFANADALIQLMQRIAENCGRTFSSEHPYFDGHMPDGSRVNGAIPPMAPDGPTLTIRKFQPTPYTLSDLIQMGVVSNKGAHFLHAALQAKLNIVVSGATGTGKTTLLSVLASLIPTTERIISIEDVAEIRIQHPNWVRLETVRGPGRVEISAKDCLVNALRMRPDRIVVGECRRDETFEMLQAMNTGHDGSLTTIHANTPRDCFARIESLVMTSNIDFPIPALRRQIASAIDLVVQLKRLRNGRRVVQEIVEVTGMEQDIITTQTIFSRELSGVNSTDLVSTGYPPSSMNKFTEQGIQFPKSFFDPSSSITYQPD